MEKEVQERFERIERNMELFSEGMNQLRQSHMELETAQINQAKAHTKLAETVNDLGEKIANLTIHVDQLIKRDLER